MSDEFEPTDPDAWHNLRKFATTSFPPEMRITRKLQDALKVTDYNLADRDSLIALLMFSVAQLEAEIRRPGKD